MQHHVQENQRNWPGGQYHLNAPERLLQAVWVGERAHVPRHDVVVHGVGQKVVAIWAERETCDSTRSGGRGKCWTYRGLIGVIHGALYTIQPSRSSDKKKLYAESRAGLLLALNM